MPAPDRSRALQVAIDRTYAELPSLLGTEFPSFDMQLQRLLRTGRDEQLLDLFNRYPKAYNRLLNHLALLSIHSSFFADSIFGYPVVKNSIQYRCQVGSHDVPLQDVKQRTAAGDPICPVHGNIMTDVVQP